MPSVPRADVVPCPAFRYDCVPLDVLGDLQPGRALGRAGVAALARDYRRCRHHSPVADDPRPWVGERLLAMRAELRRCGMPPGGGHGH